MLVLGFGPTGATFWIVVGAAAVLFGAADVWLASALEVRGFLA